MYSLAIKKVLIAASLLGISLDSSGQNIVNKNALLLLDSARSCLCSGNTSQAIILLEKMEHDYPKDGMIIYSDKMLGDLYYLKGEKKKALDKYFYALNYKPETPRILYPDSTPCDRQFRQFAGYGKGGICISISKVYTSQKQLDSALFYLNLAEKKYDPYMGCTNGIIMYRSFLSPFFADVYMAAGDTTNAINRLLDYFMQPDGQMDVLTKKMKEILLYKYSQQEIDREIDKGINEMRIVKGKKDEPERVLNFVLFGHLIRRDAHHNSLEYFRTFIAKHSSIRQLE